MGNSTTVKELTQNLHNLFQKTDDEKLFSNLFYEASYYPDTKPEKSNIKTTEWEEEKGVCGYNKAIGRNLATE